MINWYYPCSFLTRILNTSPGHVPIEIDVLKRVITYFCILNMLAPVSARDGRDHGPKGGGVLGKVSIHAPVMGATRGRRRSGWGWGRFNSRARDGRDRHGHRRHVRLGVSIHAPVMGATGPPRRGSQPGEVSIHAPVMGATHGRALSSGPARFNSRARDGRDRPFAKFGAEAGFQFPRP